MTQLAALLLTDVVDSTRLAEAMGEAATAALWSAHDRVARDLLPIWHGREIDKTDGMLLLFELAADAVGYALAYQRALARLDPPLRARAGLHVGPVVLRENPAADVALGAKPIEVEGAAKATAARVMSVAAGGQILLSAHARAALRGHDLRLQSHGHWRLKGVAEPIELFEVGEAGTHFAPPRDAEKAYRVVRQDDLWLPVASIANSLPAERDSFVGRQQALADLAARFESGARLVSVLGMGGSGKTRLAARFGWHWLGEFPGGVWFCDLSQARSMDGIARAVASGLEVPLDKGDPVVQLGHAIAGRGRCLLIFDNFEQVARHAQATLGRWLDRARQARFMVTTREVLRLPGEEVLVLEPLGVHDAAALFQLRAQSARPGSSANAEDQVAIVPLVKLLEGLPLAIELAAARVRVMPPRVLLARMSERFKLLASSGGRADRQATLRAVFDWSWDLLSPPEKAALAQLSVFEGGLTVEAAEAVLDLSACEETPWTVDALQSLVQKSFVRQLGDSRFDLLASVKEYAAEHLRTPGRYPGSGALALTEGQERHIAWFAALGPVRAIEDNCADLDNLATACRRAVALGDGGSAAAALEGAWAALHLRGPFEAGASLAANVCAMPGLGQGAAARALAVHGQALVACGRAGPAHAIYHRALACAQAAGDFRCQAQVTNLLGSLHEVEGRLDEARSRHAAALELARELGERALQCSAINGLGNVDLDEGRMDEALAHFEQALALAHEVGDRRMLGNLLGNIGNLHAGVGRMDQARDRTEQALAIARETGHRMLEGNSLCNLGMLHLVQGRLDDAGEVSQAALLLARELGHVRLEAIVLCNLGIVFERLGRQPEALEHFEAAVRIAHSLGDSRNEGQFLGYLGLLHARLGRHGQARGCLDAGQALLEAASDAFGLGMLLCGRAEAQHLAGDAAAARAALAAATAVGAGTGAGPASEMGLALERLRSLLEPTAA